MKIIDLKCFGLSLIVLLIFSWILYKFFFQDEEPFTNDNLDLLNKQMTNETNNDITNNDGSSIISWSNKLYNFQTNNQVKPISFWKPKLPVSNGKTMNKLGDMISISPEYAPPLDKSLFVNGDVQNPIDYKVVVDFKGIPMDPLYSNLGTYINSVNDLIGIYNSLKTTLTIVDTLNNLLSNAKNEIISMLNQNMLNTLYTGIGDTTFNLQTLSQIPQNASTITPITDVNAMIVLPAGVTITFVRLTSDNTPRIIPGSTPIILYFDPYINYDQKNNSIKISGTLSARNYLGNVKPENVSFVTTSVGLMDIPNINNILTNSMNLITNEITNFKKSRPDIATQLKLDGIIPTLQSFIKTNLVYSYSYPVVKIPVSTLTNLMFDINITPLAYNISSFDIQTINKLVKSINYPTNINQIPSYTKSPIYQITNSVILFGELVKMIENGTLNLFSIKIIEPIAPPHYKSLGHIFMNSSDTIDQIKNHNVIACVPESCVKEVRNWRMTDMVFEYTSSVNNMYFNIFYNPYIGTFMATTKRGIPDGKVCKVVACVKPCTVVDELIKADQCARDFKKINSSIIADKPLALSISTNEEDTYYLDKIAKQSAQIAALETKARQLQINTDKADIVNKEYNKAKLQNYVDKQARNIDIVMDRLQNDRNAVDIDLQIPLDVLNDILNNPDNKNPDGTLKPEYKPFLDYIKKNNPDLITAADYKKLISKQLRTCNNFNNTDYVRKDLAKQVCYGCTDPK